MFAQVHFFVVHIAKVLSDMPSVTGVCNLLAGLLHHRCVRLNVTCSSMCNCIKCFVDSPCKSVASIILLVRVAFTSADPHSDYAYTLQGQKHGTKIVLRGEAGCSDPSVQPGDVVFVLDQKEHRFFKRINQVRRTTSKLTLSCFWSCQ